MNDFNFFMVNMNEDCFCIEHTYLIPKIFFPSLQLLRTFQIFHVATYAFQRKGMSRFSYQELCARPCYPSSISVLKQEVSSYFSKNHIIQFNTNMKYKIIEFKNI